MRLPPKVLVTAMQSHQRYFPLERPDGSLRAAFLAISNGDPAFADVITRGNEGVLSARLQDATFSFDKDIAAGSMRSMPSSRRSCSIRRLGTLADKRDRLVAGVERTWHPSSASTRPQRRLRPSSPRSIKVRSSWPSSANFRAMRALTMPAWPAIRRMSAWRSRSNYLPEGPDSPTPSTEAGALLACAEKIDSLVGAFAIDELRRVPRIPTGFGGLGCRPCADCRWNAVGT